MAFWQTQLLFLFSKHLDTMSNATDCGTGRTDLCKKADVLVLSALDDVAWLLNLRGSDIEYNPCFFSYAVITNIDVYLFVDQSQVTKIVRQHLTPSSDYQENIKMKIEDYHSIIDFLLSNDHLQKGQTIWLSNHVSQALVSIFSKPE